MLARGTMTAKRYQEDRLANSVDGENRHEMQNLPKKRHRLQNFINIKAQKQRMS